MEELVRQEEIRAEVQAAFGIFSRQTGSAREQVWNFNLAVDEFRRLGQDAVPLLVGELAQGRPGTFDFTAVALGHIGGPEAEAALRESIEVADTQDHDFAISKKAWGCYGLALMGVAESVDLLNEGRLIAAHTPIHNNMTVIEAIAILTYPASVPRLHAQLERYGKSDVAEVARERRYVLEALRRLADPSSEGPILSVLNDADPVIRGDAVDALGSFDAPWAVAGALQILAEDKVDNARYDAAWSLEQMLPAGELPRFLALLETETNVATRGVLYRIVARIDPAGATGHLRKFLGHPDAEDRRYLLEALRLAGTAETFPMLRAATNDEANKTMRAAVFGLRDLGDERSRRTLIDLVGSPRWLVAREAVRSLMELGDTRAAGAIVRRLNQEMAGVISDPLVRERVMELGDALITMRQYKTLPDFAESAARQRDGLLRVYLDQLTARLQAIGECGDDTACWIKRLSDEDLTLRMDAIATLAELGGSDAATALVRRFGRSDIEEGIAILDALGRVDTPASRELIVRVLSNETFDEFARSALRAEAAWSARRLGGQQMIDALRESIERREGRDTFSVLYLPQIAGTDAIPTLLSVRRKRMTYMRWTAGEEFDVTDKIVRDLKKGRSIEAFDRPPDSIEFSRPAWVRMP